MRVQPKIKVDSENQIEVLKQTSVEKKRVLQNKIRPKRGHTLFKFNLETNEISKAEFKVEKEISFLDARMGLVSQNKEVDGEPNFLYVSALNKKNAIKKIAIVLE